MISDQENIFPQNYSPGEAIREDPLGALTLFNVSGVGSARFRALMGAFGSPAEVFNAGAAALKSVPGVDSETAASISKALTDGSAEKALQTLQSCGAQIVSIWDDVYPKPLREIHDPPALLFVRGSLPNQDELAVGIVGTRSPNVYGVRQAHRIAEELAERGVGIVSGMARGVDTSAHEGALQAKGKTYAVFGCGIDVTYPSENAALAERISQSGALISEFMPGTPPDGGFFPRRNRIISGLCRGVLVVQGSETSGALITARCALEQNREVFALPGNVEDRHSRGPHSLIRQGAALVESAEDILKTFGFGSSGRKSQEQKVLLPKLSPEEEKLVAHLSSDPVHIDHLVREMGQPVSAVLADLLGLEMKGWVVQLPGKLFVRK